MTMIPGNDLIDAIRTHVSDIRQWTDGESVAIQLGGQAVLAKLNPSRRRYYERQKNCGISTWAMPTGFLACMIGRPVSLEEYTVVLGRIAKGRKNVNQNGDN